MNKIKLFTHTDLDGVGCAILAYLAFGRENVDVEYCNYDDINERVLDFWDNEPVNKYDKVYITDISLGEELAGCIDFDNVDKKCLLYDHHATALWMNRYDWCTVTERLFDTDLKTSGTELFFLYIRDKLTDHIYNVKRFVSIVRDYDTWRWKELGETGMVCKYVNDLLYIYGRDQFINWAINNITDIYIFPKFSNIDIELLNNRRRDINTYIAKKEKQLIISSDQFGHKHGVVFAEQYFSELGNKLCELHPEIDYIAMIDISSGQISYRTVKNGIDLGQEIAHRYGGGGHPKAAGSTFDRVTIGSIIIREIFSTDSGAVL